MFIAKLVGLVAVLSVTSLGCAVASGEHGEEEQPSDRAAEALSGSCAIAAFNSCIDGGGGGGCAKKYCSGACASSVESCARGGGGKACANRCSGSGGSTCVPQETWTETWTWECGFPYGFGDQSSAAPGKAHATCTRECNGTIDHCNIWHYSNGRAQCTLGVPLDDAQNPW